MKTRDLTVMAMLMGLGLALHMVENALALPVLLPGAKLGLANVATLLVLARFGPVPAAMFGPVRHLLGSFLTGTTLLPTFWLGMGGSLVAALGFWLLSRRERLHTAGVVTSALFQVGQGAALVGLTATTAAWVYLPPLLALGIGFGWLTGMLATWVRQRLSPHLAPVPDSPWRLTAVLLAGALALTFVVTPTGPGAPGQQARVLVAGEERLLVDLRQDRLVDLQLDQGHMQVEVQGGRVRVAFSDCDDQVCVRTGWIGQRGRSIVCAPYRVLIQVEGGGDEVDSIVR